MVEGVGGVGWEGGCEAVATAYRLMYCRVGP